MKLTRLLALAIALLVPAAAIAASPTVRACCTDRMCFPGCPFCHHAG